MLEKQIRDYLIANRASAEVEEFGDADSLLTAGIIDSMTMVDLITYLEGTFGIRVSEDDMVPENFDSVDAISEYVRRQQGSPT